MSWELFNLLLAAGGGGAVVTSVGAFATWRVHKHDGPLNAELMSSNNLVLDASPPPHLQEEATHDERVPA